MTLFLAGFRHLESLCRLGPTQTLDRPAKYYWNSIGCCELKCLSTVCTISFDMARFPGINFLLCLRILKLQGCLFQFQARPGIAVSYVTELVECIRVSVQGVKSLGGHFACLCRGFEFYEVKKKNLLLFFKKKMEILLHFLSFL